MEFENGEEVPRRNILTRIQPFPCGPSDRDIFVQEHNQNEARTWDAAAHEDFDELSDAELDASKLGFIPPEIDADMEAQATVDAAVTVDATALPLAFDWRDQAKDCVAKNVLDQGSCGSCYAFAAATALSYRMCIHSKNNLNVVLSPQDMASCHKDDGCAGGQMKGVYDQMKTNGKVVNACDPYTGKGAKDGDTCESVCSDSHMNHQFKVKDSYNRFLAYHIKDDAAKVAANAVKIQDDIMTNGPVAISFNVHKPFYSYKTGVYTDPGGELDDKHGWHAVVFVGWGEEGGVPYWIAQNSWGEDYGEGGFFKIKRGVNEANCELYGINGASVLDSDLTECTGSTLVRDTGCWPGGCDAGEVETGSRQCWNLANDEICVKANVKCGAKCTTAYTSRWTGCGFYPSCAGDEQEVGSGSCSWGRSKRECRRAVVTCP